MGWLWKLFGVYLLLGGTSIFVIICVGFWSHYLLFVEQDIPLHKRLKRDWWLHVIIFGILLVSVTLIGLGMGILKVERIRKGW